MRWLTLSLLLVLLLAWAATESLADATRAVKRADLRAGDFFFVVGPPGHAMLLLDVAEDDHGHHWALIGQGFMPAQDFQILAHEGDPWFSLDGASVGTPFWPADRGGLTTWERFSLTYLLLQRWRGVRPASEQSAVADSGSRDRFSVVLDNRP